MMQKRERSQIMHSEKKHSPRKCSDYFEMSIKCHAWAGSLFPPQGERRGGGGLRTESCCLFLKETSQLLGSH